MINLKINLSNTSLLVLLSEQQIPGGADQQDEIPHDSLQLDLNGVLLVEPGPSVDLANTQMMSGPTQTVVVTSTQPPPQPYTHPTITTLAPLGKVFDNSGFCFFVFFFQSIICLFHSRC